MSKKFKIVIGSLFAVQMVVNAGGFILYRETIRKLDSEAMSIYKATSSGDKNTKLELNSEYKSELEWLTYRFNEHLLWSHNERALRKFSTLDETTIKLMVDQKERELRKYPDINLHD
ncbi:hypothetical protein [uncultured Endozoicomonas sp.]|uniref:hypothetical protein n=1 Tax=uncultured Endozoicomonas sp. TaxID=432652 RepID=UPI00260689BF|nr:hypothetical protein [uncultured Endozoicomonas sp.]